MALLWPSTEQRASFVRTILNEGRITLLILLPRQ